MTKPAASLALMAAQPLSLVDGAAPEWVHLLPAGPEARTVDGRGPYRVDLASIIAASGDKLPLDENHAIDLAAPRGEPAPARGYIVELQARADGLWGRVDWTAAGRALVADRAYLGISPAIAYDTGGRITRVLRASLTNTPNLRGLTALHSEDPMSLTAIAKALGLGEAAAEADILGAIGALTQPAVALQTQMGLIGAALGVPADAKPEQILAAARTAPRASEAVALQAEVAALGKQLNDLRSDRARERAEAVVDQAIAEMRYGVKAMRERYIALHMADPAATEAQIAAIPKGPVDEVTPKTPPGGASDKLALQAAQAEAARLLGIDPKAYAETLKSEAVGTL